jgi:hypothetical protein
MIEDRMCVRRSDMDKCSCTFAYQCPRPWSWDNTRSCRSSQRSLLRARKSESQNQSTLACSPWSPAGFPKTLTPQCYHEHQHSAKPRATCLPPDKLTNVPLRASAHSNVHRVCRGVDGPEIGYIAEYCTETLRCIALHCITSTHL